MVNKISKFLSTVKDYRHLTLDNSVFLQDGISLVKALRSIYYVYLKQCPKLFSHKQHIDNYRHFDMTRIFY